MFFAKTCALDIGSLDGKLACIIKRIYEYFHIFDDLYKNKLCFTGVI